MKYDWEFTIMSKDMELAHLKVNFLQGVVEYEEFVPEFPYRQFYQSPDVYDLFDWLETRCVPRNRANLQEYLNSIGLSTYEPREIVKKTRGMMWDDYVWIRFDGEDVKWNDIKHRD